MVVDDQDSRAHVSIVADHHAGHMAPSLSLVRPNARVRLEHGPWPASLRPSPRAPSVEPSRRRLGKELGMSKLRLLGAVAVALAASSAAQATVPGKNGLILYLRHVGPREQIFTARADGTHIRQLTHLTDSAAADASWSADGTRIAFARDYDCCDPKKRHLDISTMNADGNGLH